MQTTFQCNWGNPNSSEHSVGWEANQALENSIQIIADSIGADKDEIIITSGATEANNLAIFGITANSNKSRRKIIISSIEHSSVFDTATAAAIQNNCEVVIIPVNTQGLIQFEALEKLIDEQTILVSIAAINNEIGTIQNCLKIYELCKKYGVIFHSDAVHSLLCYNLSTNEADMLSISSHKIYGPKGIGALYVRREIQKQMRPLFYGGGQQSGLRPGTLPVPLCVGFAKSIELLSCPEARKERLEVTRLRDLFVTKICELDGRFFLNGAYSENRHQGNANICFSNYDAQELLNIMQPHLAASSGSACHSGINEPSHVLKAIGLSNEQANSSLRFGIGRFTTEQQILSALGIIQETLTKANRI